MIKLLDINLTNDQFIKVNSYVINNYTLSDWNLLDIEQRKYIINKIIME